MNIRVPVPRLSLRSGNALREGSLAALHTAFVGVPSGRVGWVGARWLSVLTRRLNTIVAAQLDLKADDELLDVGCGSASLLAGPAGHVRHVAGVDASEIQLGMARQRLAARIAGGTAEIVQGDAAALPWADGRFSAVSCQACLPFLPDPEQAVREMRRVLRPGGRVVITAFPATKRDPSGVIDAYGEWRWSAADLQRLVEQAGFAAVSVTQLPEKELGVLLARGMKPT